MNPSSYLTRRQFVRTATLSTSLLGLSSAVRGRASAVERRAIADVDVRIDRVMKCRVSYERPRIVAGNSGYRLAGRTRSDWILILVGNNGQVAVGACRNDAKEADGGILLGKTLSQLLTRQADEVNRRTGTSALWDLAGKSLGRPVYRLLGGRAPKGGVPVYDGSIYMEELVNRDKGSEYRNPKAAYGRNPGWSDILKEAIDTTLEQGHTFAKVKLGRGAIHLSRKAGNYQDAAVLRLIRDHAGDGFGIGVDANNGYTLEDTIWLLEECRDLKLAFIEEMFRDDVEKYRRVRKVLRELRLSTVTADGESWRGPDDPLAKEMIESGVVDILQGDMRRFQIEGILEESRLAEAAGHGSRIAPHNWASEFGFYMQVHVACAIPNFYRAEHDPGKAGGVAEVPQC